jgi:hypothetical protein
VLLHAASIVGSFCSSGIVDADRHRRRDVPSASTGSHTNEPRIRERIASRLLAAPTPIITERAPHTDERDLCRLDLRVDPHRLVIAEQSRCAACVHRCAVREHRHHRPRDLLLGGRT